MELLIMRALAVTGIAGFLLGSIVPPAAGSTPRALWERRVVSSPTTAPLISGDTIWIAGPDRKLRSLDAHTGKQHWKRGLGGFAAGAIAVGHDRVIVGISSPEKGIRALARETGKVKWFERTETAPVDLVCAGGAVHAVGREGVIDTRALEDGRILWHLDLQLDIAGIAATESFLYVQGRRDSLWCIKADDGTRRWTIPVDGLHSTAPVLAGATLLRVRLDGELFIHDRHTGQSLMEQALPGPQVARPAFFDGKIAAVAAGGEIEVRDLVSMSRDWSMESKETVATGIHPWADLLIVGTLKGRVLGLTKNRGAIAWKLTFRDPISREPAVGDDLLVLVDDRGLMVVYQLEDPS
jgi:outer membrane protein assembly factor BamB